MKKFTATTLALALCLAKLHAFEPQSEIVLSSSSEDKFVDVIQYLIETSPENINGDVYCPNLTLEIAVNSNQVFVKSSRQNSVQRNYNIPVSQSEKDDLTFITTTLARSSLPSLATSKSSLKKAGDRIDHLHPLRFLMTVFTDEELKANVSAIRSRGWVWDKFYDGLEGSLKEESKKDNMKPEFINDFANVIGINVSLILPSIQGKRWKEFVNLLIDSVPRSGNHERYDM